MSKGPKRWLGALVVLAVLVSGVWGWAWFFQDESAAARAIIHMDADVDDWQWFPSRPMSAAPDPVVLESTGAADAAVGEIEVDGRPLAELLADTETTAFLVAIGEELVHEAYFTDSSREGMQTSFSTAKSFDATMVGIAIEEGLLSLDDPVTAWVPELLESDPGFADITIEHLVSMASGIRYRDNALPWGDASRTYYGPDLREVALSAEIERPPGEEFLYCNYNPLILGMILERATGMPVTEYLESRIWHPMGAQYEGSWSLDSEASGFEKMESGINGRAVDFLKLGLVHAHGGVIDGRQVVPAWWVEAATTRRAEPYDGYGYHWWTPERSGFSAIGNHGQFIWVDPEADVVVVRMGRSYGGLDLDDWFDVFESVVESVG